MTRVPTRRFRLFVLCILSLAYVSGAQHVDVNEMIHKATAGNAPSAVPDNVQENIVNAPPQPQLQPPVPEPAPVVEQPEEQIETVPAPDSQPAFPQPKPATESGNASPPAEVEGDPPLPDPETSPARPPQEQGSPPPPPEAQAEPAPAPEPEQPPAQEPPAAPEPHNLWLTPAPGEPPVEMEAGNAFNFTWTPNTEGLVSLELWKIEDGVPVPKFLLAANLENSGFWTWNIDLNFPHGAGYTLVVVPDVDRNFASLSPLFTILGDKDYDSILPPPQSANQDPHAGVNWSELEINHEGNAWRMGYAMLGGFLACNAFLFFASLAKGARGSVLGLRRRGYEMLEKQNKKKVFHARSVSARV